MQTPDSLLKSALEKVVFFECRLDQLQRDLARAESEADALRGELAQATGRELALKQRLTEVESAAASARRERDEAQSHTTAFKSERQRWIERMIEIERIRSAGGPFDESFDLARFIAELRSEALAARGQTTAQPPARLATPSELAERLRSEGRLEVSRQDLAGLARDAIFPTRAEETLYAFSLKELSAPDPSARARAAARLRTLEPRAAVPALAAALGTEKEAAVRSALLESLAASGDASVIPLVAPHLKAAEADVRLAALEAAVKLGDAGAIERGLADATAAVRRRAAVLAAARPNAVELLRRAAVDADASVRRVAALTLAACSGNEARKILLKALDDADATVRRAAAKGLSRLTGADLTGVANLDRARRQRELRRIEAAEEPARAPEPTRRAPDPVPVDEPRRRVPAVAAVPGSPGEERNHESGGLVEGELVRPRPGSASSGADPDLGARIRAEICAALRGRTPEEMSEPLGLPVEAVVAAAVSMEHEGALLRRGKRYFLP